MNLPTYCLKGGDHHAGWIVTGRTGAAASCSGHLSAVKRYVGEPCALEPVKQPPGHDPPQREEQQVLF